MDDLDYLANQATRREKSDASLYVGLVVTLGSLLTWLLTLAALVKYLLS